MVAELRRIRDEAEHCSSPCGARFGESGRIGSILLRVGHKTSGCRPDRLSSAKSLPQDSEILF
jgi:hypothetical protein